MPKKWYQLPQRLALSVWPWRKAICFCQSVLLCFVKITLQNRVPVHDYCFFASTVKDKPHLSWDKWRAAHEAGCIVAVWNTDAHGQRRRPQCVCFYVRKICFKKERKKSQNQVLLVFHETKKLVQDGMIIPHLARFLSIFGVFLQKVNNQELWVCHCVAGTWL